MLEGQHIPAMRHAVAAAKEVGMWREQPIKGWTVSCDSPGVESTVSGTDSRVAVRCVASLFLTRITDRRRSN